VVVAGLVARGAPAALCNGNGIRDGAELCDGADTGGYRCSDLCFDGGGTTGIACVNCTFDTSDCCVCGNSRIEPQPPFECNERCDCTGRCDDASCTGTCTPAQLGNKRCTDFGYTEGGPLGCKPTCDGWDTNDCYRCGDGVREGPEECDGTDCGATACNVNTACTGPWPEHGGPLACRAGGTPPANQYPTGCSIDRGSCWVCGNGVIDPGTYVQGGQTLTEQCDDGNLASGDGCSATCQGECGNGIVTLGESCDDANAVANDGCTTCGIDRYYFGGNAEMQSGQSYDQCTLRWGVAAAVVGGTQAAVTEQGNGFTVTCRDNVAGSCDRDTTANQCTFRVYYCLNRNALQIGACFPNNVDLLDLAFPATTLSAGAQAAVLTALRDTLVRVGGATDVTQTATTVDALVPPAVTTRSLCGQVAVVVPRPSGTATQVLGLRATESGPTRVDLDQITFVCQP
jgi:cysteine-rich repeat protein